MAAPSATVRQDPSGIPLKDGYRSLITPEINPDVSFWEKTVTPPGLDGGEQIDTTTMHNDRWRSMAPRSLITMTDCTLTAAYDPVLYDDILSLLNVETTYTVRFPDGSTMAFYGFLKNATPNALVEGTHPEMTITITPTNADPTTGAEEAPVMVLAPGT